jgi:hypothetical protein
MVHTVAVHHRFSDLPGYVARITAEFAGVSGPPNSEGLDCLEAPPKFDVTSKE